MTQPSGEQSQADSQGAGGSGRSSRSPKVEVLAVGQYTVRDHQLNADVTGLGVVAEVGDVLIVRPLAGHYVQVDPADFVPLTADDV